MGLVQQVQAFLRSIFQWWVTIAPWQQGVRVRFGKHVALLPPGIHFKMPMFDVVYMQPIRVRAQHVKNQTLTTNDGKIVSLASALQYEIKDLLKMYETLHNAHDIIEQRTQSVISRYMSANLFEEIKPREIEVHLLEELDLSEFGLSIHNFSITDFAVVRVYRLINGDIGSFTGYDQRLETTLSINERPNP